MLTGSAHHKENRPNSLEGRAYPNTTLDARSLEIVLHKTREIITKKRKKSYRESRFRTSHAGKGRDQQGKKVPRAHGLLTPTSQKASGVGGVKFFSVSINFSFSFAKEPTVGSAPPSKARRLSKRPTFGDRRVRAVICSATAARRWTYSHEGRAVPGCP